MVLESVLYLNPKSAQKGTCSHRQPGRASIFLIGRAWILGALRAGLHSDTLSPTRPNLLLVALPMGQAYSNHHSASKENGRDNEKDTAWYPLVAGCCNPPPHTDINPCTGAHTSRFIYLVLYFIYYIIYLLFIIYSFIIVFIYSFIYFVSIFFP